MIQLHRKGVLVKEGHFSMVLKVSSYLGSLKQLIHKVTEHLSDGLFKCDANLVNSDPIAMKPRVPCPVMVYHDLPVWVWASQMAVDDNIHSLFRIYGCVPKPDYRPTLNGSVKQMIIYFV